MIKLSGSAQAASRIRDMMDGSLLLFPGLVRSQRGMSESRNPG